MERRRFLKRSVALSGLALSFGASRVWPRDMVEPTRICIIGAGGCGTRIVSRLVREQWIEPAPSVSVEYFGIDSDARALEAADSTLHRIEVAAGFDSCAWPAIGRQTAEHQSGLLFGIPGTAGTRESGSLRLLGTRLVILVAGLGRGAGTGFAQVIADHARQAGAITVACVTLPFSFEIHPMPVAPEMTHLQRAADIVIATAHDESTPDALMADVMAQCERQLAARIREFVASIGTAGDCVT